MIRFLRAYFSDGLKPSTGTMVQIIYAFKKGVGRTEKVWLKILKKFFLLDAPMRHYQKQMTLANLCFYISIFTE